MIIRREAWKAALPIAAGSERRTYLLDAVHITPSGVVEATNGYLAVRVTDTQPFPDVEFPNQGAEVRPLSVPALFDADRVKRLIAAMPKRATLPILAAAQVSGAEGDNPASALATDLDTPVSVKASNGRFPDLDRIFVGVADRPHIKVILAADVLKKLIGAVEAIALGSKESPTLTLEIPTEERYQGRQENPSDDDIARPNGILEAGIRVTGRSSRSSVAFEAIAMPCRREI